jgi:hypothetical protein
MSEYQYYEFQRVDGRLSEKEMQALRAYSTRARITPTSFINEYNFGNFKGNPNAWMEKYFDGFFYLANWGTREVQLAVPAKLLPVGTARRYCSSDAASSREKSGKLILTFRCEDEPDEEWLEGEGQLSALLQIRNELAQGDLRSLYLGWLLAVQAGELKDSEKEPPVPPNLADLSGPQANLADFLRIEPELLSAAARNSPRVKSKAANGRELASWIASLPVSDKDEILVRLMTDKEAMVGAELQSRFHGRSNPNDNAAETKKRTVSELLAVATACSQQRMQDHPHIGKRNL